MASSSGRIQLGAPTPVAAVAAAQASAHRKLGAEDFVYGVCLGEGAFARVLHCRLKPSLVREGKVSPDFAAKIMEKRHIRKEHKTNAVMSERNVLSRAAHPNIVRLCYTFQASSLLRGAFKRLLMSGGCVGYL